MTVIQDLEKVQIATLIKAGYGYRRIAKQLELNENTVKKHI